MYINGIYMQPQVMRGDGHKLCTCSLDDCCISCSVNMYKINVFIIISVGNEQKVVLINCYRDYGCQLCLHHALLFVV